MGELRKHKMTHAVFSEMEETICTYRGVRDMTREAAHQ